MSDQTNSIDPVADGASVSAAELMELNQQRYEEEAQRTEFDDLMQRAMSVVIERPTSETAITQAREGFLSGTDGPVGEAKTDMVSDVARPGTESQIEDNQEHEQSLETRMLSLYSDLTDYQVAWRIAQKIPQDVSQILKGN